MESGPSTAYQLGQLFGMAIVALVIVGAAIFFIIALIKSITRKTVGWIITTVLTGGLCLLAVVGLVFQFISTVAARTEEGKKITKVIASKDKRFEIKVPGSWSDMPHMNTEADIGAGNLIREQYALVLIERKTDLGDMDLAAYMDVTANRTFSGMTGASKGELSKLTVAGHPALRQRISGRSDGVNVSFQLTCLDAGKHMAQIMCWTLKGREDVAFPVFEQVAETFRSTDKTGAPSTLTVTDRIHEIIAEQLGIKRSTITGASRFQEDLGADELDAVELIMAVEEEFDVSVPDEIAEKWTRVSDMVTWVQANTDE